MKTVFIPNMKSNYDITDTERFGNATILVEDSPVDISNLTNLARQVTAKLKEAKEDDYLLIGGAPIIVAIAFMYLMSVHARVNLLIFDARTRRYSARTLSEQEVMA